MIHLQRCALDLLSKPPTCKKGLQRPDLIPIQAENIRLTKLGRQIFMVNLLLGFVFVDELRELAKLLKVFLPFPNGNLKDFLRRAD